MNGKPKPWEQVPMPGVGPAKAEAAGERKPFRKWHLGFPDDWKSSPKGWELRNGLTGKVDLVSPRGERLCEHSPPCPGPKDLQPREGGYNDVYSHRAIQ